METERLVCAQVTCEQPADVHVQVVNGNGEIVLESCADLCFSHMGIVPVVRGDGWSVGIIPFEPNGKLMELPAWNAEKRVYDDGTVVYVTTPYVAYQLKGMGAGLVELVEEKRECDYLDGCSADAVTHVRHPIQEITQWHIGTAAQPDMEQRASVKYAYEHFDLCPAHADELMAQMPGAEIIPFGECSECDSEDELEW
jgi:hypothetical protein